MPEAREEALLELGRSFRHAYRSLRSLRGRETHRLPGELGHAQYELLAELYDRGPLAAVELGKAAALSAPTVSGMLDRLEAEGHVKRVRSDADRRIVLTDLTPRGSKAVEATRAHWGERWRAALAGVSEADLLTTAETLERVGDVFAEPDVE